MKLAVLGLALLALASAEAVTPIQKVIEMLSDMLSKGKEGKHTEEVEFAEYAAWCDSFRAEREKSITQQTQQIDELTADIAKAASDAETLGEEVEALDAAVAEAETELEKATAIRNQENTDYQAQHADLSESISACAKAIQVLKSKSADVPQSLVQVRSLAGVPTETKAALEAFLAMGEDNGAPEANAYEFQSGSVVDMLEKLKGKFSEQRLALQKAEMNAKANYEVLRQRLTDNIKADQRSSSEKTSARAGRLGDEETAKGDLKVTERAKGEDEKTLADTNSECHVRSEEFEKNQNTRADEIKAITKAIEILSSPEVSGHAETHLPRAAALAQTGRSLAQVTRTGRGGDVRAKAAAYLQARSQALGSRYLAVMATRVAADPFGKVKKMIKDLIIKLSEEANAEADHHAYCTSELATNKQTRENKAAEAEELQAESDRLTSEVAELGGEIAELGDALAELQAAQNEATKHRNAERATNTKTIADAKEAQAAVERARQVLREFYDTASGASLLQAKKHAAKEPYTGMGDSSTGVMGMLDVILSDFARLETDTATAEDDAKRSYEKFTAESEQDSAVKETEKKHKEGKKQQAEDDLRAANKDLELTHEELDAALEYFEKLKADCVDTGLSYEDRARGRQEEIQSLQEALRILEGEDLGA